jgi:hypothetical protein
MALFVLVAVGIVVAQTWLDWRDSKKNWILPDWAKGLALGCAITVCVTAAASYATVWLQDPASDLSNGPLTHAFWPELAFLACVMGVIVAGLRKKRMGLGIFLAGAILVGYWLGTTLLS